MSRLALAVIAAIATGGQWESAGFGSPEHDSVTRRDPVECESAAYVVLSALGIDAGEYSLG